MAVQVSVIIPTHNRKELLARLLNSLLEKDFPVSAYEIIVVCDGVTDGSDDMVAILGLKHPNLRLITQAQGGPAAARNAGARVARGDYLAFTDDDCVATPNWLQELIQPLECSDAVGAEGRTETIAAQRTPLTHQMESHGRVFVAPTCNVAYRRSAFEKTGGFEESFPFAHNEDADLAWRIVALGPVRYIPSAVIIHPPRPETFKKMLRWVCYFESEFLLCTRNPVAYRVYRSRSPWFTIYWKILVDANFQLSKAVIKDTLLRGRPDYSIIGLALIVARIGLLIGLYPRFRRASRQCMPNSSKCNHAAMAPV